MSAARDLAEFLTGVTAADLPAQAIDHAAMLVASTFASAAMGRGIEFAENHQGYGREPRRQPARLGVVRRRRQIAGRRRRAGQRGDERRRRLRRQRPAHDRPLRDALGRDRARRSPSAHGGTRRGCAGGDRRRLRGRRAHHRRDEPGFASAASTARTRRFSPRRSRRRGCCTSTPTQIDARDRAGRDLDRRAGQGRRHQRRARIPCRDWRR